MQIHMLTRLSQVVLSFAMPAQSRDPLSVVTSRPMESVRPRSTDACDGSAFPINLNDKVRPLTWTSQGLNRGCGRHARGCSRPSLVTRQDVAKHAAMWGTLRVRCISGALKEPSAHNQVSDSSVPHDLKKSKSRECMCDCRDMLAGHNA